MVAGALLLLALQGAAGWAPSAAEPLILSCTMSPVGGSAASTPVSIRIESREIVDRRGGNWINVESGAVSLDAPDEPFLRGRADLMELGGGADGSGRVVVRLVRQMRPLSLTVVDLIATKSSASDPFSLEAVEWGLHGERHERGSGRCELRGQVGQ